MGTHAQKKLCDCVNGCVGVRRNTHNPKNRVTHRADPMRAAHSQSCTHPALSLGVWGCCGVLCATPLLTYTTCHNASMNASHTLARLVLVRYS